MLMEQLRNVHKISQENKLSDLMEPPFFFLFREYWHFQTSATKHIWNVIIYVLFN